MLCGESNEPILTMFRAFCSDPEGNSKVRSSLARAVLTMSAWTRMATHAHVPGGADLTCPSRGRAVEAEAPLLIAGCIGLLGDAYAYLQRLACFPQFGAATYSWRREIGRVEQEWRSPPPLPPESPGPPRGYPP